MSTTLSRIIENDRMLEIMNEFIRLEDKCYLDNAGTSLYPKSSITKINEDLLSNVYMNPHTDKYTSDCIEQIRYTILQHFNTDPSNYTVIFTSGTTQSLKLVVDSFDFGCDKNSGSFVYLRDSHTSVIGLRELAKERNVEVLNISHEDFLSPLSNPKITYQNNYLKSNGNTLLVYPAQSNFNGYKYPIDCIDRIKSGQLGYHFKRNVLDNWYILLDAACYVSTSKLDLSKYQPDFICLSFYKLFGFPCGLGALIVRNCSSNVLTHKKYFGGGSVDVVLSSEDFHVKRKNLHERFEDGTVPFLSILSLKHCFDVLHKMIPKIVNNNVMDTISNHTFHLAKDLYQQLVLLHHSNGNKAVILYMDSEFEDIRKQGGIVTFNLLRADGTYIGYAEFQHMADLFNINIRTGCFCNSGSCQRHLALSNEDIRDMYNAGHKCGDELDLIGGKPTGCVRVSFGYYNSYKDVDKLISMICKCFVKTKVTTPIRSTISNHICKKEQIFNSVDGINSPNENNYIKEICITSVTNGFKTINSGMILKEMTIFPIKSCGAFKINSTWNIGSKGFEYDREWMIIKDNGVALTQKQNTLMCMIRPSIDLKKNLLVLNYPDKETISVPLKMSSYHNTKHTSVCQSKVCTDTVQGYDCGDTVSDWISEVLQVSFLRLIRQSNESTRSKKSKNGEDVKMLSLSNQAQFLLINRATVQWLSDKIKDDSFLDNIGQLCDRFRGNLLIDADKELVEREWKKVFIGKHVFKVEGPCSRCQMVCIDQHTGTKTVEPLRTISEQFNGKIRFGIYLSYLGTADNSKDVILKTNTVVRAAISEENIS